MASPPEPHRIRPRGHVLEALAEDGGREGRRRAEEHDQVDEGQEGDRSSRDHRRQQRRDDRHPDRRGHGEGGQGRGHHRRRGEGDGDDPGGRRGHAVRPRVPLALHGHGPRTHGGRPRGLSRPDLRKEAQRDEGPAPAARAGGAGGQALPDHRFARDLMAAAPGPARLAPPASPASPSCPARTPNPVASSTPW